MHRTAAILFIIHLLTFHSPAQDANLPDGHADTWFEFATPAPFTFLLPYVPPYLMYYTNELKDFVRSDEFSRIRRESGDIRSVDAIYVRAMKLAGDNAAMALLLSCVATFDHEIVGFRIPIFSITLPLTGESGEDFRRRTGNLPTRIYDDTPPAGDRDKLQHFFGSAFLACVFESRDVAGRFGDFVEQGEDAVIIDGALDHRDSRANRQGQEFGLALLADNHRYPSEFLRTTVAGREHLGCESSDNERAAP